jgi:8-oxo-dGTP pyrophosphatase MutT (NUDIX family)
MTATESPATTAPARPRDAATLMIARRSHKGATILLGRRHGGHVFMPNKFVFPGGRLDQGDLRMAPSSDLDPSVLERLMLRMRGRNSAARARGLALAAIRETFEETGLVVGESLTGKISKTPANWLPFVATGHTPDLSQLRFIMRAITPPGRPRRFDARFFAVDADAVCNIETPIHGGSGELLEVNWFSFEDALSLELPSITRDAVGRLSAIVSRGAWPLVSDPVPFQYQRRGQWYEDCL